ncbi:hypothetical protein H072_8781 [Dactylellina haptotyla CBS 200.50]|uniref:Uncharacterized protein n=1 Tax=Dactylellina haptotyla (strain CBS 200.50) TaxID=1284197 RepID=S8BE17_DACHA|nr:hypothetical protein H072_8781 [Dactylellina haptotyla CBS 200.50]
MKFKTFKYILAVISIIPGWMMVHGIAINPRDTDGTGTERHRLSARDLAKELIHDHIYERRDNLDRLLPHKLTEDHILAIRDAPAHMPIRSTWMRPGQLLEHIMTLHPSIKPVTTRNTKTHEIQQFSFNKTIWNGGIADYMSHPRVRKTYRLAEIEALKEARRKKINPPANNTTRSPSLVVRDPRPVLDEYTDREAVGATNLVNNGHLNSEHSPPNNQGTKDAQGVNGRTRAGSDASLGKTSTYTRAECWFGNNKIHRQIFGRLDQLREAAGAFCLIFDAHVFLQATNHAMLDIREFSLGTIYQAVGLTDTAGKMRVNFQFLYGPRSISDKKFWFPMTIFTGMQGMCHTTLNAYLNPKTAPTNCLGKSGTDTVGGWAGINGGEKTGWQKWYLRWAVDPYQPGSFEDLPNGYPDDNKDNGLLGTDPSTINVGY